ncbi:hypothetical protein Tco_1146504 [Tanacetum coccineum]
MAALQYKDDHNKIAYLGRERGSEDFTDILSYLDHSPLRVYNFSRFILEGMIGNIKATKHKFLMYPRFLQMIVALETADRTPRPTFDFTRKMFANMKFKWEGQPIPLTTPMLAIAATGDDAAGGDDAANEDNAAAYEAAGSAAEAHLVPHSPPVSPVREPTPERRPVSERPPSPSPTIPETEWVVPIPVSPATDWRPWPYVPVHSPIRDPTPEPVSPPTPPAQTFIFEGPLVFGPEPRPAGYVDPDVIEPIIGPQPRPHGYVDPDFVEPIIFGPQPRPDTYLEPEDLDTIISIEDDTTHGGFHVESPARPDDAPTPTTNAAGRAEDPALLTGLSAKLDRCMRRIDSLESELGKSKKLMWDVSDATMLKFAMMGFLLRYKINAVKTLESRKRFGTINSECNKKKRLEPVRRINLLLMVCQGWEMHAVSSLPSLELIWPTPYKSDIKETQELRHHHYCCDLYPAASRNRPAVNSADRPNPAGWSKRPATVSAGRPVSAGFFDDGVLLLRSPAESCSTLTFFSVSQICDKKNKVLFTDTDCLVLSEEFQLPDESQVVLRIPREHDLYTFHISDLQPEQKQNTKTTEAEILNQVVSADMDSAALVSLVVFLPVMILLALGDPAAPYICLLLTHSRHSEGLHFLQVKSWARGVKILHDFHSHLMCARIKSHLHLHNFHSYGYYYSATLTNLAPAVELEPTSIAKALEGSEWFDANARREATFITTRSMETCPIYLMANDAIGTKRILKNRGCQRNSYQRMLRVPFSKGEIEEEVYVTRLKALKNLTSQSMYTELERGTITRSLINRQERFPGDILWRFEIECIWEEMNFLLRSTGLFQTSSNSTDFSSEWQSRKFQVLKGNPKPRLVTINSWQGKKQTIVAYFLLRIRVSSAGLSACVTWYTGFQNPVAGLMDSTSLKPKSSIYNHSTICMWKNPSLHQFEYLVVHIGMVVNTAPRCTFFLLTGLVSAGRTMVLLVVILSAGRLVSAGRTMILLVVILSAGRLVSAGRTMVLLVVILSAGRLVSAGRTMVLLVVILSAGRLVSAGRTMVLLVVILSAG